MLRKVTTISALVMSSLGVATLLAGGIKLYNDNCQPCQTLWAEQHPQVKVPDLRAKFVKMKSNDDLHRIILDGSKGMPRYSNKYPVPKEIDTEIDAIIVHIRHF